MRDSKNTLKAYSLIYIVLAILTILLIITNFVFPEIAENLVDIKFKDMELNGLDPKVIVAIGYAIEAIFYLWFFWLLRRVSSGKSNGTFVMVLLIASIIASVIDQFRAFDVVTMLGLMVDAYIVNLIYNIRTENK